MIFLFISPYIVKFSSSGVYIARTKLNWHSDCVSDFWCAVIVGDIFMKLLIFCWRSVCSIYVISPSLSPTCDMLRNGKYLSYLHQLAKCSIKLWDLAVWCKLVTKIVQTLRSDFVTNLRNSCDIMIKNIQYVLLKTI